jgi:hypothetical protein
MFSKLNAERVPVCTATSTVALAKLTRVQHISSTRPMDPSPVPPPRTSSQTYDVPIKTEEERVRVRSTVTLLAELEAKGGDRHNTILTR